MGLINLYIFWKFPGTSDAEPGWKPLNELRWPLKFFCKQKSEADESRSLWAPRDETGMLGRENTLAPALQPGVELYMTAASVFLCQLCFDDLSPGPREQAEVSRENMWLCHHRQELKANSLDPSMPFGNMSFSSGEVVFVLIFTVTSREINAGTFESCINSFSHRVSFSSVR